MLIDGDTKLHGLEEQLKAVRDENLALRSALCGLYVGLSHMSDIHHAIVGQSLDFAARIEKAQQTRKVHGPVADHVSIVEEIRGAIVEYRLLMS